MVDTTKRKFAFDGYLEREYRWNHDPAAPICRYYSMSFCPRGRYCPDKHALPEFSHKIVCRHWLKGLCKKGDQCEFLHELIVSKLPECPNLARLGTCPYVPACPFAHPKAADRIPTCPAYDKGFCRLGPKCTKRHVLKQACPLYIYGFCPDGPACQLAHPKFFQIDGSMRISRDPQPLPSWRDSPASSGGSSPSLPSTPSSTVSA